MEVQFDSASWLQMNHACLNEFFRNSNVGPLAQRCELALTQPSWALSWRKNHDGIHKFPQHLLRLSRSLSTRLSCSSLWFPGAVSARSSQFQFLSLCLAMTAFLIHWNLCVAATPGAMVSPVLHFILSHRDRQVMSPKRSWYIKQRVCYRPNLKIKISM